MESRPPYPPPGTYGQPPTGYPPQHAPPQVTNTNAVVALVAGIASWVLLPVLGAIVAVVVGHMARQQIRRDPYQAGDGMAVAGLVLGWIQIGLALLALVVLFIIFVIVAAIIGGANGA